MQKEITRKVESDLLLNINDINKFKKENANTKIEDKMLTIDKTLEKYNASYLKALEAPVPKINLPYNEVLIRATPIEIKSKGNLITSVGDNDMGIANRLNRMSDAVDTKQEILMVGNLVTDNEMEGGIRPGMMCKFRMDRFRSISDEHKSGVIETTYNIPSEIIDGYKYLLIDKRDIIYTYEK